MLIDRYYQYSESRKRNDCSDIITHQKHLRLLRISKLIFNFPRRFYLYSTFPCMIPNKVHLNKKAKFVIFSRHHYERGFTSIRTLIMCYLPCLFSLVSPFERYRKQWIWYHKMSLWHLSVTECVSWNMESEIWCRRREVPVSWILCWRLK